MADIHYINGNTEIKQSAIICISNKNSFTEYGGTVRPHSLSTVIEDRIDDLYYYEGDSIGGAPPGDFNNDFSDDFFI